MISDAFAAIVLFQLLALFGATAAARAFRA